VSATIGVRQANVTKDRARLLGVLAEATEARDEARARMDAAQGSRKVWAEAADDLDWWVGRVAFLSAWLDSGEVK
jgi:flagellar biosynthesis regulator FlaF